MADSALLAGIIGGAVGGTLGVVGTTVTAYLGPRKLEEWRQAQKEAREDGPRKRLLWKLLEDQRFADGRSLETLGRVTGSTDEQCRRLLIEIGARGVRLEHGVEGWALISRKPLDEP